MTGLSGLSGSHFVNKQLGSRQSGLSGTLIAIGVQKTKQSGLSGSFHVTFTPPPAITITSVDIGTNQVTINFTVFDVLTPVLLYAPDCAFSLDGGATYKPMTQVTRSPDPLVANGTTNQFFVWNSGADLCDGQSLNGAKVAIAAKNNDDLEGISNIFTISTGIDISFIQYTYPHNGNMYIGYNVTTFDGSQVCLNQFQWSTDNAVWHTCTAVTGDGLFSHSPLTSGVNSVFVWNYTNDNKAFNGGYLRFIWNKGSSCPASTPLETSPVFTRVFTTHGDNWTFGPGQEWVSFNEAFSRMNAFMHGQAFSASQLFFGAPTDSDPRGAYRDFIDLNTAYFPTNVGSFGITLTNIDSTQRVKFSGGGIIPNNTFNKWTPDDGALLVWTSNAIQCLNFNNTPDIFEDGVLLLNATDESDCASNPGSAYYDNSSGLIYIHASDSSIVRNNGKVYETPSQGTFLHYAVAGGIGLPNLSIVDIDFDLYGGSLGGYIISLTKSGGDETFTYFNGFLMLNCRFNVSNGALLLQSANNDVQIQGNSIVQVGTVTPYFFVLSDIGTNFVFQYNYMESNGQLAKNCLLVTPTDTAHLTIANNIFLGSYQQVGVALNEDSGATNTVLILNNIFRGNYDPTISSPMAIQVVAQNVSIIGNAFLDVGATANSTVIDSTALNNGNLLFQNNTVWWDAAAQTDPFTVMINLNNPTVLVSSGNIIAASAGTVGCTVYQGTLSEGSMFQSNVYMIDGDIDIIPGEATVADMQGLGYELQSRSDTYRNIFKDLYTWDMNLASVNILPYDAISKRIYGQALASPNPPSPAPVITSSLTATGTINSAFTYDIVATNTPTSYNATGLPGYLSVNTSTGVISGTVSSGETNGMEYSVSISATNAGGTDTETLVITMVSGGE